jgi:hypothetical protein
MTAINHSWNRQQVVDDDIKSRFMSVMDRMLRARWLRDYTFTTGNGFHLGWYPEGARKAICLKLIAASFGLSDDNRAPLGFDIIAQGDPIPDWLISFPMDAAVARYWRLCIEELHLRNDGNGLFALIQVVEGWAPDLSTPVKTESINDRVRSGRGSQPS